MSGKLLAVIGSSFGDEGKAKLVDYLADKYDFIVRYQGGDNAGHSVYIDGKKYIFQLIPCGILQGKALISHGVVLNPERLFSEIENLKQVIPIEGRLFISNRVQIICDWNIVYDKLIEQVRGSNAIGTTGRGIGPTYASKALRLGVRAADLLDKDDLREKLRINLEIHNSLFKVYNFETFDLDKAVDKYFELGQRLKPYLVDSVSFLQQGLRDGVKFLFEGSQGLLLDLDLGTYPFVTSSNIVGFLSSGTGLPLSCFSNVLGVVKAYSTRVGNGEFVTEMPDDEISRYIREEGNEYGSVTGRSRRIGWLDLVAVKYAFDFSGVTEMALTLVDILNNLKEIKVCVEYQDENGKKLEWIDRKRAKPVYKIFKGWNDDYSKITKFQDFSSEFRDYVEFIEGYLGLKISIISFGKDRKETLSR